MRGETTKLLVDYMDTMSLLYQCQQIHDFLHTICVIQALLVAKYKMKQINHELVERSHAKSTHIVSSHYKANYIMHDDTGNISACEAYHLSTIHQLYLQYITKQDHKHLIPINRRDN